ncbi:vitamin K epoxide reductase complex subunit 1-like protein 1 [Tubulanus polymorphus]|uniref:vitamin K epoxide reductase complex subunit 1-like protein 1 n=1 Tax=Tubulanus polymorphus TaxID=672921 RepID=UPI003DA532DD
MAQKRNSSWLSAALLLLCAAGIAVCAYAYHVETSKENDASYRAYCDLSEYISCSKVFTSRYGRGFGLFEHIFGKDSLINQPNSIFGIGFYIIQSLLEFGKSSTTTKIQIGTSIVANLGSVYLGYVLFYILGDFCIVCVSMYVVNFTILVVNVQSLRGLKKPQKQQTSSSKKKKKATLTSDNSSSNKDNNKVEKQAAKEKPTKKKDQKKKRQKQN